jgi:hypothetical protein
MNDPRLELFRENGLTAWRVEERATLNALRWFSLQLALASGQVH